jgi:THO complex subunit 7
MAAHYAISSAEDDVVIRQRLLTRTTTTRGEPPLKKLIKKFTALASEIEKEDSRYSECEKLYRSFLQELATFELPLLKTKAVIDANRREQDNFKELHVELNQQISQAQRDIEDLKLQLEEAKVERQHKEECEAIRKLIAAQSPRAVTQKQLNDLDKELVQLEAENYAASRTIELRKKQFGLLLHVVDDLQTTLDDEQKNPLDYEAPDLPALPSDESVSGAEPMAVDS